MICDRCGVAVPGWDVHDDNNEDVCGACCTQCEKEGHDMTTTTKTRTGIIGSHVHYDAAAYNDRVEANDGGLIFARLATSNACHAVTLSGTADEIRSVTRAILAAVDEVA